LMLLTHICGDRVVLVQVFHGYLGSSEAVD
jgi:hypothetical protein